MPLILGIYGAIAGLCLVAVPAFMFLLRSAGDFENGQFGPSPIYFCIGIAILCVGIWLGFIAGRALGRWLAKRGRDTTFNRILFGGTLITICTVTLLKFIHFNHEMARQQAIIQAKAAEEERSRPRCDLDYAKAVQVSSAEPNKQLSTLLAVKLKGERLGWYAVKVQVVKDGGTVSGFLQQPVYIETRAAEQTENFRVGMPVVACIEKNYHIGINIVPVEKTPPNSYTTYCVQYINRYDWFPISDICPQ